MSEAENNSESGRGEGNCAALDRSGLLHDGAKLRDDMRLVARAAREGWGVPKELKNQAVERLKNIVNKTTVSISAGEAGIVDAEYPADVNAIAAVRVLAALDSIDQEDFWGEDKNERIDAGKGTESVVARKMPINLQALSPAELTAFREYVAKALAGKRDGLKP